MKRLGWALMPGVVLAVMLGCALLAGGEALAQGCSQCRDNTAATPPATQMAYRHAIELLAGAATAFFAGTLLVFRRSGGR